MKTRNFPARKNQRRKGAFSRLPKTLMDTEGMTDEQKKRVASLKVEVDSLARSITTDEMARSSRSKIHRVSRRIV